MDPLAWDGVQEFEPEANAAVEFIAELEFDD